MADRNQQSLLLAALLIVVGLGFKAAAVPFHMWTPDAYQGAPTPVTAFMSVAPKVTAFAAIVRVLVQGLEPLREQWVPIVIVLSILTMGLGNLVAIAQRDVKRMLAYSSIAHTGYMLVGLASFQGIVAGDTAISGLLFYNFAYTFMNLGGVRGDRLAGKATARATRSTTSTASRRPRRSTPPRWPSSSSR